MDEKEPNVVGGVAVPPRIELEEEPDNTPNITGGVAVPPRVELDPEIPESSFLPGVPESAPEGAGSGVTQSRLDAQLPFFRKGDGGVLGAQVNQNLGPAFRQVLDFGTTLNDLISPESPEVREHKEELTKGLPITLWDDVLNNNTLEGAKAARERILKNREIDRKLGQQFGVSAEVAKLTGSLIDFDLPLIAVSGGALGGLKFGSAVARKTGSTVLGETALGFGAGVTAGVTISAGRIATTPDVTFDDVIGEVVGNAALGAVIGFGSGLVGTGFVKSSRPLRFGDPEGVVREAREATGWTPTDRADYSREYNKLEEEVNKGIEDPDSNFHNTKIPTDEVDLGVKPFRDPDEFRAPEDKDSSTVGAQSTRSSPVEIDPDKELANLNDNRKAKEGDPKKPVHPFVQDLADAGATDSRIRESIANRQWEIDYDFEKTFKQDTSNPFVRLLTGTDETTVPIPGTNKSIPIGQIMGTVFTLGQRDFTSLVRSKAPGARFLAAEILESASGIVRRGSTASVLKEFYQGAAMVFSARKFLSTRAEYFRAKGLSPRKLSSYKQFSRDLRLELDELYNTGKINPDSPFKELIEALDKTNAKSLKFMQGLDERRSVRGARDIEHRPGYFRHDWEPQNVKKILKETDRASVERAFRDGIMSASGFSEDVASKIAKGMVRRFLNKARGIDQADSRLLDIDNRASIEEALKDADLPQAEIDSILDSITVKAQERAKKGFLKRRIEIDLKTPIPGTDKQLVDLLSDDIGRSLQRQVSEAAGAAALANKGLRDKADIESLLDSIILEQEAAGEQIIPKARLRAIMSQFGGGAHKGFIAGFESDGISPLASIATKITRSSLLQRVGLTQVMDTANIPIANGVKNGLEPIMAELGWNKPGSMSKADFKNLRDELESLGVIAGQDQLLFQPHLSIDETELAEEALFQTAQAGASSLERITNNISGQILVTNLQQLVSSAAITTNVMRTLAGHKTNLDARKLRDLGLEPKTISDLNTLIKNGVIEVDNGVVRLNTGKWAETLGAKDTDELINDFGSAVVRGMDQQVQKGLIGETSVWMNNDVGKFLSALKTFSLTAVQKQSARNAMIGNKAFFAKAAAWQIGMAYGVLTLAQSIQGNEMSSTDRARLAVAYSPTLGVLPSVTDPVTTLLGMDDVNFSPYGRYASIFDTPVAETVEKLTRAPGSIFDLVTGDGDYNDVQNAKAMFLLNTYGAVRAWEALQN